MKSITNAASEKELSVLRDHYKVPAQELATPCETRIAGESTEFLTANGWRITLYDAVEPLAEAPGTWTVED